MYGQETNQQPQQSQQTSTPFPMDTPSVDNDFTMTFDEDTGAAVIGAIPATSPAPAQTGIADQGMLDRSGQQSNSEVTPTSAASDARIAQLEAMVAQQNGVLQQLIPALAGFMQGQQPQPTEPQYDLSTQEGLASFLDDRIQKGIKQHVDPIMAVLPRMAQSVAYQEAATDSEFRELEDAVRTLMTSDPNLPVKTALTMAKNLKAVFQKSAKSDSTSQQPKQQGPAQALVTKAQQLQPIAGVNGSLNTTPAIKNFRDAFEQAYAQESGIR